VADLATDCVPPFRFDKRIHVTSAATIVTNFTQAWESNPSQRDMSARPPPNRFPSQRLVNTVRADPWRGDEFNQAGATAHA
jgi:hypothetical protein